MKIKAEIQNHQEPYLKITGNPKRQAWYREICLETI